MSIRVIDAVLLAAIDPPARKLLAVGLANHAHDDGTRVFPGIGLMRVYVRLKDRQIYEHLEGLVDDKVLRRVGRGYEGRRAEFRFDLDRLAKLAEGAPERRLSRHKRVRPSAGSTDPEGAVERTERVRSSTKRVRSGAQEGAVERTPDVRNRHEEPSSNRQASARTEGEEHEGQPQSEPRAERDPFALALEYQRRRRVRPPMKMLTKLKIGRAHV